MHDADDLADSDEAVETAIVALSRLRPREHPSAGAWLLDELAAARRGNRPVQVAVLRERAQSAGWAWEAVERARAQLDVVTVRRPVDCWRMPLARER